MRRVMRELSELEKNPPEGIRVQTSDEDMLDVTGIIEGPGALFPRFNLYSYGRLTRFCSIKMVRPMRVDISESSSNLLKNFLLRHQNVRQIILIRLLIKFQADRRDSF